LFSFAGRVGEVLVAPRAAFARIDARGGGLRDTLWLVALGVVGFRFPRLLEGLLGLADPGLGALGRVLSVVAGELQQAAWVVIPAALIVTVAAGGKRDPSQDLELGAACYAPYFVVRGLLWVAVTVLGWPSLTPLVTELAAGAAAVPALAFAVLAARARQPERSAPDVVAGPRAVAAGLGVVAVAAVALGTNALWSARHLDALRPMRAGEAAPEIALPRLGGGPRFSLDELRGRVVVLDFWATWCPPCRAMMPVLDRLHGEWAPAGVEFVGVDSDGEDLSGTQLQGFVRENRIPYTIVVDDGSVGRLYKVRALPQLVIIGRDGAVLRTFLGYTGHDAIDRALREATGRSN
jgi:thiol-disulfide isomerase/thioredoxin